MHLAVLGLVNFACHHGACASVVAMGQRQDYHSAAEPLFFFAPGISSLKVVKVASHGKHALSETLESYCQSELIILGKVDPSLKRSSFLGEALKLSSRPKSHYMP